jgi:DNA-binding CsgD family transcriptional regulator
MPVHSLPIASKSLFTEARSRRRASISHITSAASCHANQPTQQRLEQISVDQPRSFDRNWIWHSLLDSLPQGVMVISRNLRPVYFNQRAQDLCQSLLGAEYTLVDLPVAVSEVCQRLLRQDAIAAIDPVVLECQVTGGQLLRISARWLSAQDEPQSWGLGESGATLRSPYMLVFLENATEIIREQVRIEQKKYDLTERETDVWLLLRQEHSYQDIATLLGISLNTVKTHAKNAYAKKRTYGDRDKFWCSQ